MKEKYYIWVLVAVAVMIGILILSIGGFFSGEEDVLNVTIPSGGDASSEVVIPSTKDLDLTQTEVDFESDMSDLESDLGSVAEFDDDLEMESLDGEIY